MDKRKVIIWTKERCRNEALKYQTRTAFKKGSSGAYYRAIKDGFLDEICSHMALKNKGCGYWTKERCLEEAKKYKKRTHFYLGNPSAYTASRKHGILNEVFGVK